ncbi:3-hydroxybutyryl-CoA dehydrogenase [Nephila pilipes]|uniref:3-hydroxybutyryl-CoA dehydrogenase n=1 Tax=Nephila pilipes TaxID=299642 RepID=A0A8X6TYK6_NEPPI|nr:3-hydroxybutyryl-CoA dehydrogenase [Nephila pilipes]
MVKVTVIGGGCLGVKIIGELAFHGHEVRVYDRSPERLDYVRLRVQDEKALLAEDGLLPPSGFVGDVLYISRLEEAVRSSDFIFEAVPEDLALKQDLFEWVSQCCKSDAVIATNSMTLNIDQIAERASHKERCIGVRYLYPVYCIPEVEIVPSTLTSLITLDKVRQFLSRMGKVAFFRSGKDPLVLTSKQREAKKAEFIKNMRESKGTVQKIPQTIPNLADKQILSKGADFELDEHSGREKDCVVCMDEERNCMLALSAENTSPPFSEYITHKGLNWSFTKTVIFVLIFIAVLFS